MNAVSQSAAPGSERAPAPSLEAPPLDLAAARLFRAFLGVALLALALGGLAAAGIAAVRTPALGLAVAPLTYYRLLTLHGLATFYHWLLFFQVALLFLAVGLYIPGARPFSLRMGWVAFGTMLLGASLQTVGALAGGEVLYTAFAPLAGQFPRSPLIYSGFLLLSIGLLLVSIDYILTVTRARHAGLVAELPTPTFVGLVWSIVTSAAAVIAIGIYTPALMWVAGIVSLDPMAYMMGYFTYFHVNHYVPLIAAVGVWYALAKHTTGATSILGEHFSKAVFTVYAIIVPPTFLYHLFLAPGVPDNVKTVGSVLSMFIGVPTIIVAIVIVGMLEARMRAAGAIGRLGWLRHLPWGEPAFGGLAMSMATFGVGGRLRLCAVGRGAGPPAARHVPDPGVLSRLHWRRRDPGLHGGDFRLAARSHGPRSGTDPTRPVAALSHGDWRHPFRRLRRPGRLHRCAAAGAEHRVRWQDLGHMGAPDERSGRHRRSVDGRCRCGLLRRAGGHVVGQAGSGPRSSADR